MLAMELEGTKDNRYNLQIKEKKRAFRHETKKIKIDTLNPLVECMDITVRFFFSLRKLSLDRFINFSPNSFAWLHFKFGLVEVDLMSTVWI